MRRLYHWLVPEKVDRAVGLLMKFMGILTALVAMNFFVPTANVVISSVDKVIKIDEQAVEDRYASEGMDLPQAVRDTIKHYNEGTLLGLEWVLSPIWETGKFEWVVALEAKSAFAPSMEGADWAEWLSDFYSQTGYCELVEDPRLCRTLLESALEDPRLRAYGLLSDIFGLPEVAPTWARVLVFQQDLSDEEITLALDAMSEAQHLSLTVVVENEGKAKALNVEVKAIDDFQPLEGKDDELPALESGEKKAFYFTGSVGEHLQMSENELEDLFDPSFTTAAPPGQLLNTDLICCLVVFAFVITLGFYLIDRMGGEAPPKHGDSQEKHS